MQGMVYLGLSVTPKDVPRLASFVNDSPEKADSVFCPFLQSHPLKRTRGYDFEHLWYTIFDGSFFGV